MTVSSRWARLAVVATWALFFFVLWLSNDSDRYLGPRTQWVVPFGACALVLTALVYGAALARSRGTARPLTLREAAGLAVLVCPIAVVLLVPNGALGSFAASRKGAGTLFLHAKPAAPASPADVSFLDIRIAEGDPDFAAEAGIRNGLRVRLLGLRTRSHDVPAGTFELARFYIACCVADAQPVGVPVDPPGRGRQQSADDLWLDVTGKLERRGKHYVVVADAVRKVSRPAHPYLTFRS
jgi:putative membrane protein